MELLLELLPEPELGYEGTGTGGAVGTEQVRADRSPRRWGQPPLTQRNPGTAAEASPHPKTCWTHRLSPGCRIPNLPGRGHSPQGLTLLHGGAGIKERVMEKFICRRRER